MLPIRLWDDASLIDHLAALNAQTAPHALSLSSGAYLALLQNEASALCHTGRIDFGGSVLDKLALAFCTSPDIQQADWVDTLRELLDLFYAFKNDTYDQLCDNALIASMADAFTRTHGSLRLLADLTATDLLSPDQPKEDDDEQL